MIVRIFARRELVDGSLAPEDPALLLEGSWPAESREGRLGQSTAMPQQRPARGFGALSRQPPSTPCRRALDDLIDGRFDWIDRQAAEFAEQLGPGDSAGGDLSAAYVNALALRYYLVKLIRPLAYFTEVRPLRRSDHVELVVAGRDKDYADVLARLSLAAGAYFHVRWVKDRPNADRDFPSNPAWRRYWGRFSRMLKPSSVRAGSPRVVLCGNPRLLDPVCRELLARGCNVWRLYDRFAVRSWLRWRGAGAGQLVCDSSLGRENRLTLDMPGRLDCRGVNLALPVERWLEHRVATHGPRQSRLIAQLDAHFRDVRPDAVVLDEDATPLARAAVAVARRYTARSLVVQHGVPCCRFGFAPAAADRVLVWGRSSQRQLIRWGVPAKRIRITGAVQEEGVRVQGSGVRGKESGNREQEEGGRKKTPRILLLTTVPPRDERPDAVSLHLTGRTYAEMLRMTFAAIAQIGGAELIIKLHPRTGDDPVVRALKSEFAALDARVVSGGPFQQWLPDADCVLSCGSSAGVEATRFGVPVIQLTPSGAKDFLPHDEWGLWATARSKAELGRLLGRLLSEGWQPPIGGNPETFADFGVPPAARIVDEILNPTAPEIQSTFSRRVHAA